MVGQNKFGVIVVKRWRYEHVDIMYITGKIDISEVFL